MTQPDNGLDQPDSLESPDQRFERRLTERASAQVLQARLVSQETGHLAAALEQVAADGAVPRAAALIVAARRRFTSGAGKSAAYAGLLAGDLATGLSHVQLVAPATAIDVLAEVTTSDVLVAFSFRRYRRETTAIADAFAAAGGTVIAVTDRADAPVAAHAAETIVVNTGSASYVDSPTAVVAVAHILATLTVASAKGARRRISARESLSHELGLYL